MLVALLGGLRAPRDGVNMRWSGALVHALKLSRRVLHILRCGVGEDVGLSTMVSRTALSEMGRARLGC